MAQAFLKYSFLLAFLVVIFTQQVHSQSADITTGCAPLTVNFSAGSVAGPWLWDLGGTNSSLENPTRVFTSPGTYSIELNGNPVTTITVYSNPVANFDVTGSTSGCASPSSPLNINFVDQSSSVSGNITEWLWDFGDGNSSTQQNPTHAYTSSGVFTVTLRIKTQFGCEHTIVRADFINANGSANVNFVPRQIQRACEAPFDVQFTNNSSGLGANPVYTWEVFEYDGGAPQGMGAPLPSLTSNDENPTISFPNEGSYTVRLRVDDATGCGSQYVRSRIVVVESYILGFTYSLAPAIPGQCLPVAASFAVAAGSNVNRGDQTLVWEFLDAANNVLGTISGKANQNFVRNPVYSFPTPGTYTVRLSASGSDDNCPLQVYDEQTIVIPDLPVAIFTSSNNASCLVPLTVNFDASSSTNADTYAWDFDNDGTIDFTSNSPTVSHTYNDFGIYDVRLIVSDATGCEADTLLAGEVQIEPITADFSSPRPQGCNDINGDFTARFRDRSTSPVPITDWQWEFIDEGGNIVGTIQGGDPNQHQNPSFVFNTDPAINNGVAQYSVRLTVTTAEGCQSDTLLTNYIQVGNEPLAAFSSNPPIGCPGQTARNFIYEGSMPFDSLYWYPLGVGVEDGLGIRYAGDDPNYSYTYNAVPVVYIGALVVWNGGCSDTTNYTGYEPTDPTFLQLAPYPGASWYRDDCQPSRIYFVDESFGPQYWRWDFGDGSPLVEGSVRDYLPSEVPSTIRNPSHQYATSGNYTVTLTIETDNVYYVRDSNGNRIKNQHFLNTGLPATYTTNEDGELLHFGQLVTEDSVIIRRCTSDFTLNVNVPDFASIDANISSDYNPAAQNCAPVTVSFQEISGDPEIVAWYWSLGNGEISYLPSPTTTYTEPGKYTIEIVLTNERGCKFRKIFPDYIHVKGPIVSFEYCDSDVCIDDPNRVEDPPAPGIRFRDFSTSSVPILYRTWDMGNGIIFSNDPGVSGAATPPADASADLSEFTYQYPLFFPNRQVDGFEVTLTVTDESNCQSSQTVKVRPTLPNADDFLIEAEPKGCNSDTITVSLENIDNAGFGPFRYTWIVTDDLGNEVLTRGPTLSRRASFSLSGDISTTPVSAQQYFITLRLEDFKYFNQDEGCYIEITKPYLVDPVPPEPEFIVDTQNGCGTLAVQFTNQSTEGSRNGVTIPIESWLWDFGDGTTSTEENPLKIYTEPGVYTPRLTLTDEAGCQLTKIFDSNITVQGTLAQLRAVKVSGTTPDPSTPIASGTIIDFVETVSGTPYTVGFSVTDVADINAVGQFVWDFGDGVVITTPNTQTYIEHTYTNPGVYTPTLSIIDAIDPTCQYPTQNDISIVANGCNPPSIDNIDPVCPGTQVTLLAREPVGTIFNPINPPFTNPVFTNLNTGAIIPATVNIGTETTYTTTVIITETTEFSFAISDNALPTPCTSTVTLTVEALPETTIDAGTDQVICINADVTLEGKVLAGLGDYDYEWTSIPDIGTVTGTISFTEPGPVDLPSATFNNVNAITVFTLSLTPQSGQSCPITDNVVTDVSIPPTVDAGSDAIICDGESVLVNGNASGGLGALTYLWIAPTGLESSIANPNQASTTITLENSTTSAVTHTYQLVVTDDLGCSNTSEINITVQPKIIITGFAETNICSGDEIPLTGSITGGSGNFTYQWSSSNGIGSLSATNIPNPMASPSQTTIYTLLVTDNVTNCTAITDVHILVNPPIIASAGTERSVCLGISGEVLDASASGGTGAFTYEWTPSTFLDDPNSLNPTINNITATTEYTLTVTDLDAGGNPNCSVAHKVTIFVTEPLANAGTNQEICINDGTLLLGNANSGTAPYNYDWQLVNYSGAGTLSDSDGLNDSDVGSRQANPRFLANNPTGTYTYSLTVEDADGCISVNSTQVTILVNPLPDIPEADGALVYCFGDIISLDAQGLDNAIFRWYVEDPTANPTAIAIMVGNQFTATANVSRTLYLTQENASTGCISPPKVIEVLVNPIPPAPVITLAPNYCAGDAIAALNATGENIRWYDTDGNFLADGASYVPTVSTDVSIETDFTFFATQTVNNCESPQASVVVKVYPIPPPPNVIIEPNCEADPTLKAFQIPNPAMGTTYRWYQNINTSGEAINFLADGSFYTPTISSELENNDVKYYVTQTVNGCVSPPREVALVINALPELVFEGNIIHCFETEPELSIDAGSGSNYLWFDGSTGQTTRVTEPGRYTFEVFNDAGCSDTASIEVVELCPARLFVPSAFTPNQDGNNDVFKAYGKYLSNLKIMIYNEWGEVIFVINDLEETWDGTYLGDLVPMGTYVWKASYFDILAGRLREKAGTVTVIR